MAVKLHRLPRGAKGLRGMIKARKGPVTGTDLGLQKKYGSMERAERVGQMEQMERGLEAAKSVTGSMVPGGLGIKAMRPRDQQGIMAKIKRALTGKVPAKPVSVNISQFKKDPKHSLTSTKVEMFNELLPFVLGMGEAIIKKPGVLDSPLFSRGKIDYAGIPKRTKLAVNAIKGVKDSIVKSSESSSFILDVLSFGEDVYTMGFADAQRKLLSLVSKKKVPLADYLKFLGRPDVKKVEERSMRGRIKPKLPK